MVGRRNSFGRQTPNRQVSVIHFLVFICLSQNQKPKQTLSGEYKLIETGGKKKKNFRGIEGAWPLINQHRSHGTQVEVVLLKELTSGFPSLSLTDLNGHPCFVLNAGHSPTTFSIFLDNEIKALNASSSVL